MTLSELVPSLDLCQQLKAAGFPQDTAMVWAEYGEGLAYTVETRDFIDPDGDVRCDIIGAPTAGELEEWLRQRVGNPLEETTVIISHDGSKEVAYSAGVRSAKGKYTIAYGDTDIAARVALVLEAAG